jgi:transcriptional regulator GlxA family with amidase domain
MVVFPDLQVLDLTGPHEVFSLANRELGRAAYDVQVVAGTVDIEPNGGGGDVRASCGLRLGVDRRVGPGVPDPDPRPIDTLLVAGGRGAEDAADDDELLAWLRATAPTCRRFGSVCTGAFVLAAAGLLDGRRATTHWSSCDLLRDRYPDVTVETDPIFVRDGDVVTSAGVTAGIDLALSLVEEDEGAEIALAVARTMVVFVQRPGGQSQFSAQLVTRQAGRPSLRDLQMWIVDNPAADLTIAALAGRMGMSPRHLARVFRDETGTTPAQYVETVRVEAARRLLEGSDHPIGRIAREVGFGTVETLIRAFRRRMHASPGDYRRRFTRQGSPT